MENIYTDSILKDINSQRSSNTLQISENLKKHSNGILIYIEDLGHKFSNGFDTYFEKPFGNWAEKIF